MLGQGYNSINSWNENGGVETREKSAKQNSCAVSIIIIITFLILTIISCNLSFKIPTPIVKEKQHRLSNTHLVTHQNETKIEKTKTFKQEAIPNVKKQLMPKSHLITHQNEPEVMEARKSEREEIVTTKKQLTANEIRSWNWDYCDGKVSHNRTQDLYEQLSVILEVFERHNVKHVIADGTLIGAMRDNGMNPWEVDNDIMLLEWGRSFPFVIYEELFERGIILFFNDVWRACKYAKIPTDKGSPWGDHYFPYTDIYPMYFLNKDLRSFGLSWNGKRKKKNFGDISVYVPEDDEFTKQWLYGRYPNWKSPPANNETKYGQAKS